MNTIYGNMGPTIQRALDEDGHVRLGPGIHLISKSVGARWDCLKMRGEQSIIGSGPATVLMFEGAGRSASGGDWRGIGITGNDNLIENCTIDTRGLVDTEEQTHPIHVTGPSRNNTIRSVWFYHPERVVDGVRQSGGDCIKIASYEATPSSMLIDGCHFVESDRSAIASVGGIESLIVRGCTFYSTVDQDIDIESITGVAKNILLHGNVHHTSKRATSGYAIHIGLHRGHNVQIADCILDGRGALFGGLERVMLSGTTVVQRHGYSPTVEFIKDCDDVRVSGCTIVRESTATPNSVFRVQSRGTGMPGTIDIDNCTLRNETTAAEVAEFYSAREVVLSGCRFEWRPTSRGIDRVGETLVTVMGFVQTTDLDVHGCRFVGPVDNAIAARSRGLGVRSFTATGNRSLAPVLAEGVTVVGSGNRW